MRSFLLQSPLYAAVLLFAGWGQMVRAQEFDPLNRPSYLFHQYTKFDEALEFLRRATALPVVCPEDTARMMRSLWSLEDVRKADQSDFVEHPHSAKELLDAVCGDLNLRWKYDPQKREISVDCPWRRTDSRSAADLFQAIWRPGKEDTFYKDDAWWDTFHGLLSKPENFAVAGKVQQAASLQSLFHGFSMALDNTKFDPNLGKIIELPVVSVAGDRYLCLFLIKPMEMSPGHGWMAYYWFKEDGTLAGADLMNTGHRLIVDSVQVHDRDSAPSDVTMTTAHNNNGKPTRAHFVLTGHGLQLIEESNLGRSLINPLK